MDAQQNTNLVDELKGQIARLRGERPVIYHQAVAKTVSDERARAASVVEWFMERAKCWGHGHDYIKDWMQCADAIRNGLSPAGIRLECKHNRYEGFTGECPICLDCGALLQKLETCCIAARTMGAPCDSHGTPWRSS